MRAPFLARLFRINLVLRVRLVSPRTALDPESPSVLDLFRRHIPAGIGTIKVGGLEVLSGFREWPIFSRPETGDFFCWPNYRVEIEATFDPPPRRGVKTGSCNSRFVKTIGVQPRVFWRFPSFG